ncbi:MULTISPECIES: LysR family transcriptional regulator [Rhodomicrobium]|uniref:LysR family transcriptional regulator n=1 Tax=Rhodomicrobium TaxID=1068 RepID=UPI00247804E3|nr:MULTISPECIES: LysR family transcriptional regulator [Rhodomicrobium]
MPVTPITDLEIFARVAAAGNMSAAGRDMGLSPAVVSKRISHMEERLGARLFQRTTRQLKLTETGEGFYERVVGILADIEEAEAFVSQLNDKASGTLRVTAPTAFARMHIAPHLATFMRQHPDLTIEMQLSDQIVDIVGEGMDLAIRVAELDDSSLVARKLAPSRHVICGTPGYLDQHGRPKTLADLAKHNCLTTGFHQVWRLDGPDGPSVVKVNSNLRSNSSDVVHEAVLSGLGLALRSTWEISEDLKAGRLDVVLPEYRETQGVAVFAVYPCRQFIPAKLKFFVDFLAQQYGPTPYWDRGLDLTRRQSPVYVKPAMRAAP